MIRKLTPILWTDRFEETLDFYIQVLGFTCDEMHNLKQWAAVRSGQVELMISKPNDHISFHRAAYTGSFYFYVDDVEFWYQKLHRKAKLVYDIETFEWQMREFAIADNNGYILQFGQDVADQPA